RREKMTTVWFNAWQYSTENELWAAFLQSVLNKMHADLRPLQKVVYNLRLLIRRVRWQEILGFLAVYSLRLAVSLVPLIVSLLLTPTLRDQISTSLLQLGGGLASTAVGFWILARPIIQSVRQNVTIDFEFFRQESNYQEHIAFLD